MNPQPILNSLKIAICGLLLSGAAQAASLITAPLTNGALYWDSGLNPVGYAFTLSSSVVLDKLGVYDVANGGTVTSGGGLSIAAANDGLIDAHTVSLWSYDSGTGKTVLLASGIVAAGGAGTDDAAGYIYTTPTLGAGITLEAGVTYVLGETLLNSTTTGDHYAYSDVSSIVSSEVTVLWAGAWGSSGSAPVGGQWTSLAGHTADAFVGPNLTFETVPEPAAWAMLVGGVGMMAFARRACRRGR